MHALERRTPTATSNWASVALGRLQVCTCYRKEDAVPVAIEQKDQRRSGHFAYWVRREALRLKKGKRQQHCCCKRLAIQDRIFQHSPQSLQTRRQLRSKHQGDWQTPCKKQQVHTSRAQLHVQQSAKHHSHAEWKSASSSAMDIRDCDSDSKRNSDINSDSDDSDSNSNSNRALLCKQALWGTAASVRATVTATATATVTATA